MKRAISLILSIVMIFSVLPMGAFATENTAENSGFTGSNIAPMATLTLSESVEANYDPASSAATNICNGNYEDSFARNATTLEGAEDYYQFNWEDSATVEGVRLYNQWSGQAPTTWKVFVSADGETQWTEVASISNVEWTEGDLEYKDLSFARQTGIKGLRVQIVDANLDWGHYTIYELEIYGKVTITGNLTSETNTGNMNRIPYNNEDLIVDLDGVFFPRPIFADVNGDGYVDMYAACVGSNIPGVMVFYADENTQENYTYSKGYRLNSTKYWPLFPSYTYNEDHTLASTTVLVESVAYPDFLNTFTNGTAIDYAKDVIWPLMNKETYNRDQTLYSLTDYNGDGKRDLICGLFDRSAYGWDDAYDENGVWTNERMHGWVMWAENIGTEENPVFSGTANVVCINGDSNNPVDNFGKPYPNFADFDHDGDLDLICGNFINDITYYQNIGTATEPVYASGVLPMINGKAIETEQVLGMVEAYDWDCDGWMDLITSQEDGKIAFWRHSGNFEADGTPIFEDARYFQQPADNLDSGVISSPYSLDWDNDGDEDLFVGDAAGFFYFIENITIDGAYTYRGDEVASLSEDELIAQLVDPSWAAPVHLTDPDGNILRIVAGPNGSVQGPGEELWGYVTISMGDWDGDGDMDIIANSIWGKIVWLENLNAKGGHQLDRMFSAPQTVQVNDETPDKPSWTWWDPEPYELATQHRSTPFMIDWNGDGLQDIIMVDSEGCLAYYERNANGMVEPPAYIFGTYNGANKFQITSQTKGMSGRVRLTMTDWDMDGDLDLIWYVNSGNNVRYSENKGQDNSGIWRFQHHGLISDVVLGGHETSPAVCDWNRDGAPDLIIGGEAHYYYYVNPNEAPEKPKTASDYLMAHWDFEGTGEQVYADKATKDAIDDNLLSKNASNITIQNGIATITGNGALYANDSVELSPTEELTIYFRAYVGNDATNANNTTLIDKRSFSTTDTTVWPGVDKNARSFGFYKQSNSVGDFFTVVGSTSGKETVLTTGEWRDFVFVISKDPTTGYLTQTLYQSAVVRPASASDFVKKVSTSTILTEIPDTNVPLVIGNNVNLKDGDVRIFDEVRLYNKALTIDELVQDLDLDQPCAHSDKEVTVTSYGDSTHTVKEVCKMCDEMLSEISGNCADGSDADATCDICGYEPEAIFEDDFENLDKVWSVKPSYNNIFLTEGNDGTYNYLRLNATVKGNGGGASSYAVPVAAGQTYRVELTYKTSAYLTVYTYSRDNTDVIGGTALHSSNRNIDKGTTSWITRSFTYTVAEGASYMNIMVYFHKDNAPAYADFRKITIKNEATGELVENFKLDRGWNYYTTPATDGTHSINYGKLNSYNTTNVINLKTGAASNGLRSPVIPVTAGEKYYVSFRYSSHKNTQMQIEYWDANGVAYPQKKVVKTSIGGYTGFKTVTVEATVPAGYQYMTIMFHDQYYNLFVDDVKVYQPLPCAHTDTASATVSNNDGTHTVTVTCTCGHVVSTVTAACVDNNADMVCDICKYSMFVATKPDNLYASLNPGFNADGELTAGKCPTHWSLISSGSATTFNNWGDKMACLYKPAGGGSFGLRSAKIPVTPGQLYYTELDIYGNGSAIYTMEFWNEADELCGSTVLTPALQSKMEVTSCSMVAPENAVAMSISIRTSEDTKGATVYVDDLYACAYTESYAIYRLNTALAANSMEKVQNLLQAQPYALEGIVAENWQAYYLALQEAKSDYLRFTDIQNLINEVNADPQAVIQNAWDRIDSVLTKTLTLTQRGTVAIPEEAVNATVAFDGITIAWTKAEQGSELFTWPDSQLSITQWPKTESTATLTLTMTYGEFTKEIDYVVTISANALADIYIPDTGIVNPPTVIQNVTSAMPASSGKTPAVAIMQIDSGLNILDEQGNVISSVADFEANYSRRIIPAYIVDSQEEADALAQYFNANGIIDAYVVADSANASLVKSVRNASPYVRGALIFEDLSTEQVRKEAHSLIFANRAYVAISKAPLDEPAVTYFNRQCVATWSVASDMAGVYTAIVAGYTGVISNTPDVIFEVYENIDEITVSGKPLAAPHRGVTTVAPENTVEAIRAAVDMGFQTVEIDLRLTADGILILDHDGELERTTDYENRLDEFTKGKYSGAYTLAELKKLNLDSTGGNYQIATFEEVIQAFANDDIVFILDIKADTKEDTFQWLIQKINKMVEQYSFYDRVVYNSTSSFMESYNTLNGKIISGVPVLGSTLSTKAEDELVYLQDMLYASTIYDSRPSATGVHANENFLYQKAARGMIGFTGLLGDHEAQSKTLLTSKGFIGGFTDLPEVAAQYVWMIQAEDAVIDAGEQIDLTHNLVKIGGIGEEVTCNFIQLSGPALIQSGDGYIATEGGEIQLVFYTTVTAPGGDSYRIYSEPVTYTVETKPYSVLWNVELGDDLNLNFHIDVNQSIAETAYIHFTVADEETVSYCVSDMQKNENGYYVLTAAMAAAQMTDAVTLQVVADGFEGDVHTYSIAGYAEAVLNTQSLSDYHAMVREMLNYGAAAQQYFQYNLDKPIREELYAGAGSAEIDASTVPEKSVTGSVSGVSYYGTSMIYETKNTLRFYFVDEGGIADCTFTVAGKPLTAMKKGSMYYVDVQDINPHQLGNAYTLTVTSGDEVLTIAYSPLNYMARMSQKGDEALQALLKAMYNYHLTAKAFVEKVVLSDFVEAPEGKQNLALTATASAQVDATLGNSAAQLNEGDRTWSLSRPATSLEGQTDYYYLTWDEAVSFNQVVLFNQWSGQAPTAWTIAVTTDGESWKEIGSAADVSWSEGDLEGKALTFAQQDSIIGLRLQIVDASLIWGAYTIYELEVY